MKSFSSLAAVMGLWLAVSFLLWLCYRLFRRSDGTKQKRILASAIGLIDEGAAVFYALRSRASERVSAEGNYRINPGLPGETLKDDVRSLLNGIEAQSGYFERVNALKKKIQKTFGVPDFLALSEILQIRRDFWAASEIFLMDGIQDLDPELADSRNFETFQAEAEALLFRNEVSLAAAGAARDPVELRLAIAKEDAAAFQAETERNLAAELEKSRFPTAAELIAVPWSLIRAIFGAVREVRYLLADAAVAAQSLARAMGTRGLKGAVEELRSARASAPWQFATAFERAGGLARQGGQGLKRHYEFVIEAQELRARYAELLSRAPDLPEKGKQFLARLELERRAEQFRESSGDTIDRARQALVAGIAYLIAALQYLQAKITPQTHKQVAPIPVAPGVAPRPEIPESEPETPLRVLLLPASAYQGGNRGAGNGPAARNKKFKSTPEEAIDAGGVKGRRARFGDKDAGGGAVFEADRPAKPVKPSKPAKPRVSYADGLKKMPFKDILAKTADDQDEDVPEAAPPNAGEEWPDKTERREPGKRAAGSLLDRLSTIGPEAANERAQSSVIAAQPEDGVPEKPKGWRFSFGSKRK